MKRWMTMVGMVGLLLMALAMPGGTRAQEMESEGCAFTNDQSILNGLYAEGSLGSTFAAGERLTFAARPPTEGDAPTTISLYQYQSNTNDTVLIEQVPFPGTLEYIVPTDGQYSFKWNESPQTSVTWTVQCDSEPPPPTVPTCFGQDATIYVKDGTIVGGPDNGKTYKNKLKGTKGNDVIVGTEGKDTVNGSDGNDVICGLGGDDTLNGNNGDDRLDGGSGKDKVDAGAGNDQLVGGDGDDTLQGNDGNDTLNGGAGKDRLEGGKDNDTLTGGTDADKFSGGPGTDTATDYNASEGDTRDSIP